MKLSVLLENIKVKNDYEDVEISGVTEDSRTCKPGYAFVCTVGAKTDGHNYVRQALENGAAVIIAERDTGAENQVLCADTREAYAVMCGNWFGNPASRMKLVGVTGTNGKTTTTFMIYSVLEKAGYKCGLIGTVTNIINGEYSYSGLTTPTPFELQKTFYEMAECGTEYCIMEVSSQALAQQRVAGCRFETAVFTNLTEDHLDYHGTFEAYAEAKAMLFRVCGSAVMNYDDSYREVLMKGTSCKEITYSAKSDNADFTAKSIKLGDSGSSYTIVGNGVIERVNIRMPGLFNVYNSSAALLACRECGVELSRAAEYLSSVSGVKGRVEVLDTDTPYKVIIDYAHTPDGLENVISSLNEYKTGRVIALFGCGGDRDRTKRPIMGEVVARLADVAVVTSDNPRTEQPDDIIKDILVGMEKAKIPVYVEPDRRKATEYAMSIAQPGDIVLLAGKGHEDYQIIGTEKRHYDEREVVAEILGK